MNQTVHRQPIALLSIGQESVNPPSQGKQNQCLHSVNQLSQALAKLGWQIDWFTRRTHPDQPKVEWTAPHCRTIRLNIEPNSSLSSAQLPGYVTQWVKAFQDFQAKEGTHYPLIHTQDWLSGQVGLKLKESKRFELIHTNWFTSKDSLNTINSFSQTPTIPNHWLRSESTSCEQIDQVILLSSEPSNSPRQFPRLSKSKAKAKLGLCTNEKVVLYVGQLDSNQGIDTLITALKLYRDRTVAEGIQSWRCLMVSSEQNPEAKQEVKQWIHHLELDQQVLMIESIPSDQHWLYYTAADVCVIPSRYEPFGSAALAALDHKIPIVASDVQGLRFTIVPEETGLLVPPGDAVAFADAIHRVLWDELFACRLKRQTTDGVISSLSWNQVAAHLSDLYRRRLAGLITAVVPDVQNPCILYLPSEIFSPSTVDFDQELMQVS